MFVKKLFKMLCLVSQGGEGILRIELTEARVPNGIERSGNYNVMGNYVFPGSA